MKRRNLKGLILDCLRSLNRRASHLRDHGGTRYITGSPGTSSTLVTVLAGYKDILWPLTLDRLHRNVPAGIDVCIVTPGKRVPALEAVCQTRGWTYLWTAQNKTGLALNHAITAHPKAERIFKLDEDIFIANGFFDDMEAGYNALLATGTNRPGFCSPTLNVNGISYLEFLDTLGLREAFHREFGEVRQACSQVPIHYDPKAAEWVWRRTLPFDNIATQFRHRCDGAARLIGTRFSIGAIYFERSFWQEIDGFAAPWTEGLLGTDETVLCAECVERSRPMFYLNNVFAGHFSFGPQESGMLALMDEWRDMDPATFGFAMR
jgi:hypothetical protein